MKREYAEKLWNCCITQGRLGNDRDYDRGILGSLIVKALGTICSPHAFDLITANILGYDDWKKHFAPVIIGYIQMLAFDTGFETLDLCDENYQDIVGMMGAPDASGICADAEPTLDNAASVTLAGWGSFRIECGEIRCLEIGDFLIIAHYRKDGTLVLADGSHSLATGGFRKIPVAPAPKIISVDGKDSPVVIVRASNGARVSVENI